MKDDMNTDPAVVITDVHGAGAPKDFAFQVAHMLGNRDRPDRALPAPWYP